MTWTALQDLQQWPQCGPKMNILLFFFLGSYINLSSNRCLRKSAKKSFGLEKSVFSD